MSSAYDSNLEMIKHVANRLGSLRQKVVFLGGATIGFLISDRAMPAIRSTVDVDIIIEIISREEYYQLEKMLRSLGFVQRMQENDPICRWLIDEIIVDVMPTEETILGFSNRWYSLAIANSKRTQIDENLTISVVTAPYFLATKIEAFHGRGKKDYLSSHDIEDIITMIDGRKEILDEIRDGEPDLKHFLSEQFQKFLNEDKFIQSLPGHLLPDKANQARLPQILERLEEIAKIR